MKTLLTILACLLSILSFAQPSGDIQKDTALANQYLIEAIKLGGIKDIKDTANQTITLLKKATELYEAHPFNENLIIIQQELFYAMYQALDVNRAVKIAFSTIERAEKEGLLKSNPCFLYKTYHLLSDIYSRINLNVAKKYSRKSLACIEKTSLNYFTGSKQLASMLASTQEYKAIDSLILDLENIVNHQIKTDKSTYQLYIYQIKAVYYSTIANYEQAILYHHKLFEENEKINYIDRETLSALYTATGQFYRELAKYKEAIVWTNKGKDISSIPQDHAYYGNFYSHLGSIYRESKQYDLAIENYKKALNLSMKDSTSLKINIAQYNYFIAYCSNIQKKYTQALKYLKISLKQFYHPTQSALLSDIYVKQGNYKASVQSAHEGVLNICTNFKESNTLKNPSIYEQFKNPIIANRILARKGIAWYKWGIAENAPKKIKAGIEIFRLCLEMEEQTWSLNQGFEKGRAKASYHMVAVLNPLLEAQEALFTIFPTDPHFEQLLRTTEKRKAIQLIETLSSSLLPKELVVQEKTLLKRIHTLGRQLDLAHYQESKDTIQWYQNKLLKASEELQEYLKNIQKNYPKISNHFYTNQYAQVKDIQEILPEETLFISYNLLENSSLRKNDYGITMLINKDAKEMIKINLVNLKKKIKKLNELIQDPFAFQNAVRDEFIDLSHELYNTLIKPIESELEGKTELMIVVEGNLFHLPFELLLPTNEKKPYHQLDFLIKKYAINYHYSATAFLKLQEKATVKDNSLLAFAPVFTKGEVLNETTRSLDFLVDSLYNGIKGNEFVALPNTKKEVKSIAKIVKSNNGKTNILLQKNATKTKLAQSLESQSYQFVHIATHGLVNFKNPRLSALACYSKNETMDNLMYANEIQFKDINADLVVLSSCESGIGQLVEGEGLIALNRSFIYSGAKNVLFSLWKVSDSHSSDLMIDFYKNYYQGQSYTEALRNAKLKMLSNSTSAQPKYWSAFVLMGQ